MRSCIGPIEYLGAQESEPVKHRYIHAGSDPIQRETFLTRLLGVNGAIQSHPRTDITRRIPTYPGGPVFFHDSDGVQDVQMTDLFGAPWYLCRLKGADPRRRFVESDTDKRRSAILTPLQFDPGLFPNYAPWHILALESDLLAGRYGLAGWDGKGYDTSIIVPPNFSWWDSVDWSSNDTYFFLFMGGFYVGAGILMGGGFLGGAMIGFGINFAATGMATHDIKAAANSGAIGAVAGAVGGTVAGGAIGLFGGVAKVAGMPLLGQMGVGAVAGVAGGATGGFTGGTLGGLAAGQSWDEALESGVHAGLQGAKWGAAIGAAVPLVAGGTRLAYRWAYSSGEPQVLILRAPDGKFYSVAFQTELGRTSYPGLSRALHFREANQALLQAMESSPAFTQMMRECGVNLSRTTTGLVPRTPPPLWTWHHAQDAGIMQLVPRPQHTAGSIWWNTLHPGSVGGYSIWGK